MDEYEDTDHSLLAIYGKFYGLPKNASEAIGYALAFAIVAWTVVGVAISVKNNFFTPAVGTIRYEMPEI